MRRLYSSRLTTCSGGNISRRAERKNKENIILFTASSVDKAYLKASDIAVIDLEENLYTPKLRTSIETKMHLAIYKARKDVKAIVHAHPVYAGIFTAHEKKLRTDLLAEAWFLLGKPAEIPYAVMGSGKLAELTGNIFKDSSVNAALMENHGVITVGETLQQAYDRMEVLEAAAKMTIFGELTGMLLPLNSERIEELNKLH